MIKRPLIAMFSAAVLFAVYLWDVNRTERSILTEFQQVRLLFFRPEEVTAVVFGSGPDAVRVERSGADWRLVSPREAAASSTVMEGFLENLRGAKRHSPQQDVDPEETGLDSPQYEVSIELLENGETVTRTLQFGRQPGEFSRLYARTLDNPEETFTISDWVLRQARKSYADIRDKSLLTADFANATKLTIENRRQSFSLDRASASAPWQVQTGTGLPLPADVSQVERFTTTIASGMLLSVIDNPTSTTAELGFDAPRARLYVQGEALLTVGAPIPGREQFIVKTADGTIGTVPGSLVGELFRSATEWGTKGFFWAPVGEYQQVESASGNARLMLLRSDKGWIFPTMPGMPVRPDKLSEFLENLTRLSATRLVTSTLTPEEELRYGFVEDSYTVSATDSAGRVMGARFGRTDTREGITYVLRTQDRSLWQVPFRQQSSVFRFARDLQERRLLPDVAERSSRLEVEVQGVVISFDKTPAAWRVQMPEQRPVLVADAAVNDFLFAFQQLESDAEMMATQQTAPIATFRFYEPGSKEPFSTVDLVNRNPTSRKALLRMDGRLLEIDPEPFDVLDTAMASLLAGARIQAEEAPADPQP